MKKDNTALTIQSLLAFFDLSIEDILKQYPEMDENQILKYLLSKLKNHKKETNKLSDELEEIQDVLYAYINRDFSKKLEISQEHTDIDALKLSINYQGEELESAFAELELRNKQLNTYNEEKAVLLKEIHHRVKNNLQVITSLLSLQSNYIDNKEVKGILKYSQFRINSMAMVHDLLYKSEDLNRIDYEEYVKLLVHTLITSNRTKEKSIAVKLSADPIKLNINTAIPLGLLINEIVTNAIKYGLKGNKKDEIYLNLIKQKQANLVLFIGDNGSGFDENITFETSNTLGLKLIHQLSLQLRGSIRRDHSKIGTHYILEFKEIL